MSTSSIVIKQELLDTLDKLISHSQNEAKQLKDVLQTLKEASGAKPSPLLSSPPLQQTAIKQEVIEIEDAEDPPASTSDEPLLGMETLLKIKEELMKDLHKIGRISGEELPQKRSSPGTGPSSKRPRIELDLPPIIPPGSLPSTSAPPPSRDPNSTPMVLVPIPASMIEELLKQNPGSPVATSSLACSTSPPSLPTTSSPSVPPKAPLLSPTLTSSVLRFCERRAARDSVDVFHYLPADARISPFNTPKNTRSSPSALGAAPGGALGAAPGGALGASPGSALGASPGGVLGGTNYRKLLDDITKAKQNKQVRQHAKTILMNERTVYSTYQADRLEECFALNEFLNRDHRAVLANELDLHPDRIKVWYQNRRAKKRREEVLREKIEAAARSKFIE